MSIKCEIYVEFLPEEVFEYFFHQCSNLRVAQFIGPVDWIVHEDMEEVVRVNGLPQLEMFVLSNTSSELMQLGMRTVNLLLETCPQLVALGDLKTWRNIDYFDPSSDNFFKHDSAFMKLKKDAQFKNWDIDFDIDNCKTFTRSQ